MPARNVDLRERPNVDHDNREPGAVSGVPCELGEPVQRRMAVRQPRQRVNTRATLAHRLPKRWLDAHRTADLGGHSRRARRTTKWGIDGVAPPILLAEDDEAQALLVRRVLRVARLINPVHVSPDGEDALAYLEGSARYANRVAYPAPVVALVDVGLPLRSGLDVLAAIRGQTDVPQVPIVMLSASTESIDIEVAISLGAASYLVKPVAFAALVDTLRGLDLPWALEREPDAA